MDFLSLLGLSIFGSIVSLAGGVLLLSNARIAHKVARYSGPFSAGALIAAVFIDLLPEAAELNEGIDNLFLWVIAGIVAFFILERRLRWFHHHHEHAGEKHLPKMLVVGDALHNAIDGVAIALAFLADPALGVVTTIAVAIHELPQEIGDFGLLLRSGWGRRKVLYANVLTALTTVAAAVLVYALGHQVESLVAPALALTGGMLLYIALSDVVPSVHEQKSSRKWLDSAVLLFLTGIVLVWGVVEVSHNYIHSEESEIDEHSQTDHDH